MTTRKLTLAVLALCALAAMLHPVTAFVGPSLAVTVIAGTTANTGARATAAGFGLEQASRIIEMDDDIYMLDPNKTALLALMQKLRSKVTGNPQFKWLEDEWLPTSATTSASATTTSTTVGLTAGQGKYFRPRDLVKVIETGEMLYVVSVSGDTLTIIRNAGSTGGTAAANITSGGTLLIVVDTNQEFAGGRALLSTQKTAKDNYTQTTRTPYGSSGTLQESDLYGGKDLPYQAKKAGVEHEMRIERGLFFGEKFESLAANATTNEPGISDGNYPIRGSSGLEQLITTNITTDPTITEDSVDDFIETGMRYGDDEKIAVMSRRIYGFINAIARQKLTVYTTDKSFPLRIMQYLGANGTMKFLVHHQLTGPAYNATTNPNYRYAGYLFLLDFENLRFRYMKNRNTKIVRNIAANDADGTIDEYKTEWGLQLMHERKHAIWRGIRQYA